MAASPLRLARRILVTVIGVAVVVVGIVLLVAPGPGIVVVALGLVILGTEYEWARRGAETARKKAADVADQAVSNPFSTALSVLGGLAIIAAGVVWALVDSLPFSGWATGATLMVSGVIVLSTIVVSIVQARRARAAGRPTPAEEQDAAEAAERG